MDKTGRPKSNSARNVYEMGGSDDLSTQDKDFRKLIRSFTRRSMSTTTARLPSSSELREGSRHPSLSGSQQQIDDNDVIRLIASKGNDEDSQKIKELCRDDPSSAPIEKIPSEVLCRARNRRKSMEKVNVFSPDLMDERRLSELYDASEHLYRRSISSQEQVKSTA